ncbi:diaminohydroxyphosphoribosylaminopyrimidine deaminase/5-amino-6-(5-phosphoribosylamino)uracil reductase [Saccharothrix ecbatanensis]|uniref:Diaminohydroxyphosphoribosylaminopyrimidine deaminase/5-amino-6-(5-phosphoribosylamino)uracil reductase n=1 Tax=Saccharothrix ecbatanensis TaxID=1105145 RepID=A0A7W9M4G2_9PSEU|nr:RibD family protein [Saccharothrix ecbatanensis]MBB5806983.1 diaminohydroxyphosphoribosylaminopyrimidine deaminase/5-amino-6-(5-phosphoribosylamino)uracil reductase [Saccharothrix ecbatanensis]
MAALSVDELVGRDEWDQVIETQRRPFLVYKFAATLDGRIAAEDGTSQWITSAESRAEVHLLRAGCDATVVGSGTQQADNPNLAVRGNDDPRLDLSIVNNPERQPLRVVIDSNAKTPRDANVCNDAAPTLIVVAEDVDASHLDGVVEVLRVKRAGRGLDLHAVLAGLLERGVRAVFLEGGPTLAGSFIAQGLVDRVVNYVAPALLGSGKSGLEDAGIRSMSGILRLELVDVARSGSDVRLVSRPVR